jgi:hypothetical protein
MGCRARPSDLQLPQPAARRSRSLTTTGASEPGLQAAERGPGQQMNQRLPITWLRAAGIAAVWVVLLTGLAIGTVLVEELLVRSNSAYLALGVVILLAFTLAPFRAGRLHGSARVGWLVGLFGIGGLVVAAWSWGYAYSVIGGGP